MPRSAMPSYRRVLSLAILDDVSDADLAKVSEHLTPDVRQVLTVEGALAARQGFGGTVPERVAEQVSALRTTIDSHAAWAAGDVR
jgi:argininosuccinate lyase